MYRKRIGIVGLIYIVVGFVFAVVNNVLTTSLLRQLLEVVLYALLWPLTAFGVVHLDV